MAEAPIEQVNASPGPREQRPRPARPSRSATARAALVHGAWLIVAGGLRALRIPPFRRASRAAGASLANVGAALVLAGWNHEVPKELGALAAGLSLTVPAARPGPPSLSVAADPAPGGTPAGSGSAPPPARPS